MGLTPAKPLAALSPKQMAQIAQDNVTVQSALTKRLQALDNTVRTVDDKLANDEGLAAYPDARQRLERIKTAAQNGKSIIGQEQALRGRLGAAAQSGDQVDVKQAQSDLATLKKNNPKIFGKGATSSPTIECPPNLSSATCDTAISNVNYLGTTGPSSPLSADNLCYGTSLAEWDGWDKMVAQGCATVEERDIITAMSANEGSFETVQSYDSMALTFGAMQKTVNTTGGGEFSEQLAAFKEKDAATYQRLFADHGWTVESGKTYYRDAAGTKRTGSALQAYLRSASHADQAGALGPLRSAGRDPAFRKQQICDFIARLENAADRLKTVDDESYPAGDFVTSTKGKAMLLDSSVNGGPAESSFQKAVDWFYINHPAAGKNPTAWTTTERGQNEAAILGRYSATRRVAAPVTETRAKRNAALSSLSSTPNPNGLASQRPARNCPDCN
jgi:hypothetical protein